VKDQILKRKVGLNFLHFLKAMDETIFDAGRLISDIFNNLIIDQIYLDKFEIFVELIISAVSFFYSDSFGTIFDK